MLGNGKSVDLFKLYLTVRENGGYLRVSENGLWGLVAKNCGFDLSCGVAVKLVYVKYLDALERWMLRFKKSNGSVKNEVKKCDLSDVELQLKDILTNILDEWLTKSSVVEENCVSRKRKRECYSDLVRWVSEVAKNPYDPDVGCLPERSKWKDYGNEVVWKRVLMLRDEMLLKRDVDSCAQYSIWQIKQKMHPSMYDDSSGSGRLRCSQRVLSAKDPLKKRRALLLSVSPSSSHDVDDQVDGPTVSSAESAVGFWWKQRRKRIPVGPQFQADIPESIEEIYESDSKWLGTQIWPLDKQVKKRTLVDRNPVGKGRKHICGCRSPGSYDCVKVHIFEKRRKVKIDLGSAYYQWKFDSMGEEVALSWSREEERKFQDIVKSNPLSEEKSFWNEIFKFFPNKSRESLVSYYFNVFLLRRRGDQNRTNASNVDSDDDESEYGPRFNCFGRDAKFSIFRSPKKNTSGSKQVILASGIVHNLGQ
ncbi:hypothetical protein K7X08_026437 [Anisodus acutangulus]|uniref:ARID domain-containing protein n=1 Tax=Anisodus acutangulus TaxID=402998 RepID=A0A9Q1LN57_9SOLA|nr:hypothetical protein K7X08_026437 [Anisodus acutangulus]